MLLGAHMPVSGGFEKSFEIGKKTFEYLMNDPRFPIFFLLFY